MEYYSPQPVIEVGLRVPGRAEGAVHRMGLLCTPPSRVTLPPDLVADLGVGWDRVAARDQRVGETNEAGLLLGIAPELIRTAGRDLVKTNVLLVPVRQWKL